MLSSAARDPPLLLVHGWPETWYAWRLRHADPGPKDYTVVAVDQRGIGLTEKPAGRVRRRHPGHRPGRADGRARPRRFAVVGHDTGVRDQLRPGRRLPRPGRPPRRRRDPGAPGADHSPPLFVPAPVNNRLWHIAFNRLPGRSREQLVEGREDDLLRLRVRRIQGGHPARGARRLLRRPLVSAPAPCPAASRSTGRGTPPWRRTASARRPR